MINEGTLGRASSHTTKIPDSTPPFNLGVIIFQNVFPSSITYTIPLTVLSHHSSLGGAKQSIVPLGPPKQPLPQYFRFLLYFYQATNEVKKIRPLTPPPKWDF